jgi:hypothetical protein
MAEVKDRKSRPPQMGNSRGFEQAAAVVLGNLQSAMMALVRAVARIEVRKAADVERALGMDRKLCWQVYRIATASNPLAAGANVPARVSVERLLKTAKKKEVAPAIIEGVSKAYREFERLVERHAATRGEFDALIAAALPEEQEKLNFASREAIYHAARNIRGVTMQTALMTQILHPAAGSPELLDVVNLVGHLGLRRIRRGALIECTARILSSARQAMPMTTLEGRPVNDSSDAMLPQFCSDPAPIVVAHDYGEQIRFTLEGEEVGMQAAVDSVFVGAIPAFRSRFATPERATTGMAVWTDAPSHWQVIDLLAYEGLFPEQDPMVRVYDMIPHGPIVRSPDRSRDIDVVAFNPPVRFMGRGVESFRCLHVPRYMEMLKVVCDKRGWDPDRLHGYRVEIEYPVYSWQTMLALRLASPPGEPVGT